MADNILSSQQISALYKQVAQAFVEEGVKQLSLDLNSFKKQIDLILKEVKLHQIMTSHGSKYWVLANATPKRQALAARGYVLIFRFREWLLNERLNYRYYYKDNQGNIHSTEMTEENILNFIKFSQAGLQINPTLAKTANSAPELYNSTINQYYQLYW